MKLTGAIAAVALLFSPSAFAKVVDVPPLQGQVTQVQTKASALSEAIAALKAQLQAFTTQVNSLNAQITALNTWIVANQRDEDTPPPPPPPPPGGFPNAQTTGVPAGWVPTQTLTGTQRYATAGAVIQNIRIVNGGIVIAANNITIRNVEVQGGLIDTGCRPGTLLENVSVIRAPGQQTSSATPEAIGPGGYTARRVKIDGLPEGFRVSGKDNGCGPVVIEDSFVHVTPPDLCGDWHGDALQGYFGNALNISNVTLIFQEGNGCFGTAAFFYPSGQGNTSATINRLLVQGGGYPFRLGMPGSVVGLKIVSNSWGYGPIDVKCSAMTSWEAQIVTVDANFQPTTVRAQPCNSDGGS